MTDRDYEFPASPAENDDTGVSSDVETVLWQSLDMEALGEKMTKNGFLEGNPIFMGTGATKNACMMCSSNSNTTAGCNTCCR